MCHDVLVVNLSLPYCFRRVNKKFVPKDVCYSCHKSSVEEEVEERGKRMFSDMQSLNCSARTDE